MSGKYTGIFEYQTRHGLRYRIRLHEPRDVLKSGFHSPDSALACLNKYRAQKLTGDIRRQREAPNLKQAMAALRAHHQRHTRNPKTLERILDSLETFLRLYGIQSVAQIDQETIWAYRAELEERPKQPGRGHKTVSGFMSNNTKTNYLRQFKKLVGLPCVKPFVRDGLTWEFWADDGERKNLVDWAGFWRVYDALDIVPPQVRTRAGYREHAQVVKAVLLRCLFTGERKSDLLSARRADITERQIRFVSSKTGKRIIMPTPAPLWAAVQALPPHDGEWLFPSWMIDPSQHLKELQRILRRASRDAGLVAPMGLHMVRHLCADTVARLSGNAKLTQDWVGWSQLEMVDRYTHLDTRGKEEILVHFDAYVSTGLSGGPVGEVPVKRHAAAALPETLTVDALRAKYPDQVALIEACAQASERQAWCNRYQLAAAESEPNTAANRIMVQMIRANLAHTDTLTA